MTTVKKKNAGLSKSVLTSETKYSKVTRRFYNENFRDPPQRLSKVLAVTGAVMKGIHISSMDVKDCVEDLITELFGLGCKYKAPTSVKMLSWDDEGILRDDEGKCILCYAGKRDPRIVTNSKIKTLTKDLDLGSLLRNRSDSDYEQFQ
ncbi:hypothetical protein GIB67_023713, partial [Kingdonia uniflora]